MLTQLVGLKKLALCGTVPGTLIYVGQISFDCKYLNQLRIKSYLGFSWDGKSSAIKKWHFFLHLIHLLLRAHDGLLQNNCVYTHSNSRDETSKILCNSNKNLAQFRLAFHLQSCSVVRWGQFPNKNSHLVLHTSKMSTTFCPLTALFLCIV